MKLLLVEDELLARIRALGRRSVNLVGDDKLQLGALELDLKNCQVSCPGAQVKLTLREMQLLEYLLRNRGQVLTKEQILDRVWGFDKDVELSSVELYVFYLRKKIDFASCGVSLTTIRGVGYCMKEVRDDS